MEEFKKRQNEAWVWKSGDLRGRNLVSREPNLSRRQRWQHPEPLAAGLEAAGLFRSDIRQVDAVGTLRAEARGREARQLVFLGYRLQFHSLFSFQKPPHQPPHPPMLHSVWKERRGSFWSKVKNEGKIYEYTQAWDQKLHSQLQWKSRQGKVKKKRIFHIWWTKKSCLADEAHLCVYYLKSANIYGYPTIFEACVDSHPQLVNAKIHITHERSRPTSPIPCVLLVL